MESGSRSPWTSFPADLPIADIGLETIVNYSRDLKDARVTVLNGPTGIFEQEKFRLGTAELLKAATESGYSIAGGGHSVAAIEQLGLESKFSHVSMGGGASITYLSGEPLPGIEALKKAAIGCARLEKTKAERIRAVSLPPFFCTPTEAPWAHLRPPGRLRPVAASIAAMSLANLSQKFIEVQAGSCCLPGWTWR